MHLSTLLDCDVVAVEQTDELTLLVELTAPTRSTTAKRQPATLQVVLDRSGSMAGDRLEGAKTALLSLVDRLDPADIYPVRDLPRDLALRGEVPRASQKDVENAAAFVRESTWSHVFLPSVSGAFVLNYLFSFRANLRPSMRLPTGYASGHT